jgi:hypothetical protein
VSRIGKQPVEVPSGVSVERTPEGLRVKGPAGTICVSTIRGVNVSSHATSIDPLGLATATSLGWPAGMIVCGPG